MYIPIVFVKIKKRMIYFTPFFYYSSAKLMNTVSSKSISWFRDFIGVGYRYHDVYMNVIPLFEDKVHASDNYKRFKAGYENKAILRFGIYKENPKKKDDDRKYDLEILKKSKSVYDIAFLKYEELSPESIEWQCIEENK